jgi:hypothetical protein
MLTGSSNWNKQKFQNSVLVMPDILLKLMEDSYNVRTPILSAVTLKLRYIMQKWGLIQVTEVVISVSRFSYYRHQ